MMMIFCVFSVNPAIWSFGWWKNQNLITHFDHAPRRLRAAHNTQEKKKQSLKKYHQTNKRQHVRQMVIEIRVSKMGIKGFVFFSRWIMGKKRVEIVSSSTGPKSNNKNNIKERSINFNISNSTFPLSRAEFYIFSSCLASLVDIHVREEGWRVKRKEQAKKTQQDKSRESSEHKRKISNWDPSNNLGHDTFGPISHSHRTVRKMRALMKQSSPLSYQAWTFEEIFIIQQTMERYDVSQRPAPSVSVQLSLTALI